MEKLPDAVFILDTKKEHIGVTEANKLGIPIIAVVDTNCDPDIIQYVIPGNDDAIRSGNLMCRVIADAVEEGRFIASRRGDAAAARPWSAPRTTRRASPPSRPRPVARRSSPSRSAMPASPPVRPRAAPRPSRRLPSPKPAAEEPVAEAPVAEAGVPERSPGGRDAGRGRRRHRAGGPARGLTIPTPRIPPPQQEQPAMPFTAKDVQNLRQASGAGMMDAKRALEETDGDFDAAAKLLREKGLAKSVDRAERENTQGVVAVASGPAWPPSSS